MVATQLRHVDDPDRLPQPPIPPLCEAQPHLHAAFPCPRSFARAAICGGDRALHCRPALLALIRVCRYSENAASPHLNVQSPRAVPSLPSRESALRCAAPPCGGALFHPFPQGPLFHPAPPPTSDLPTDTAHFRSTTNRPLPRALPTASAPNRQHAPASEPPTALRCAPSQTPWHSVSCEHRGAEAGWHSPAHPQPPARFPPPISRTPARPLASAVPPQSRQRKQRPPRSQATRHPLSQRTPPAIPPSAAPSDALPYALPPGWPPWSTLVASGCSFSVSMRTNPTISNGTTYRKMGTSASE